MDILIFVGIALVVGVVISAIFISVYKRSIASRLFIGIVVQCIIFAIGGYIIGKLGITLLNILIALVILLPITIGVALYLINSIVKPIKSFNMFISELSTGKLSENAALKGSYEIAEMETRFNAFLETLRDYSNSAAQIAEGDLTCQIKPLSIHDTLGVALTSMISNLRSALQDVQQATIRLEYSSSQLAVNAQQAGIASAQIATTVQQVAQGTTQQSDSVTRTVVSIDEMSRAIDGVAHGAQEQSISATKAAEITTKLDQAINQVAGNAEKVRIESENARTAAIAGAETVADTVAGMERIHAKVSQSSQKVSEMGEKSEKIGSIIEAIEEISSQTNLLALNAAIEAARAGDAGKGFAVVADEVRKLAEKTSLEAKEIANLVQTMQGTVQEAVQSMSEGSREVESGVAMANSAGRALKNIQTTIQTVTEQAVESADAAAAMRISSQELVLAVNSVSAIVEENTSATEQMAASSQIVTQSIEDIASISEENSAAVEEVSASAEEMSEQVDEVSRAITELADMAKSLQKTLAQFSL